MIPMYPYVGKETKCEEKPITFPPQHQARQPGLEYLMNPIPISENPSYLGSSKLMNKVAIITGGDSGIGRAVAIAFAKEGADVVIVYLNEHQDAETTKARIEQLGRRCLALAGDLRNEAFSAQIVNQTMQCFGRLDIVVNNAAVQFPQQSILNISSEQLHDTFRTNIYPLFYLTKAALPCLKAGSSIISTASVTAYEGNKQLIDYSSTKGAIVSFTRSLSQSLVEQGIRVNAVAPGPIWTPLIPASFSAEQVKVFGTDTPMKRAGQPFELAPAYVYLASDDASYVTGQVIHVNGGVMVSS
ncbi:SDR family oxidoreductase [Desulforamulus ruminis]|uniref:Short-chain dehydrogenase/reductase SDR n=1 Tax=Desulforamulus ruminis (strain ATCC 23193 / DSM 2154 / NCIMB 8452 / DL) TaxID=696281 RepID=F6DKL5_DESRL|nr:SDR family oxidoreductase [Desulforamulus ruminis]AEG60390.1 short-chain dehydrogenase/reductase SDR [Desulforamulus ruminis DSM 2154]